MSLTWQMTSEDSWDLGTMVRGVVRGIKACVYFDPDNDSREGGWVWLVLGGARGLALNRTLAIEACERALGILPELPATDLPPPPAGA